MFPVPTRLLSWLHSQGLHTTLNLHPHEGCKSHEEQYQNFNEFMGNPGNIEFKVTDPRFMEGYFKFLHRPHEDIGVDFWWIDWQHGDSSDIPGLDPLVARISAM